ncbi:MAG TPA: protoheme IX farnesyltransferase [Anaerolineae bacterium]|nr:protoheme IX farnesyltransferase [Anaerolineae bacterium]
MPQTATSSNESVQIPAKAAVKPGVLRTYIALMKPKIILLLLITTWGAMLVAGGGRVGFWTFVWTTLGGILSAGGSNAINHYLDRDIDELMYRTKRRPIPAGWVKSSHAIAFGIVLNILAFALLSTQINLLAAILALMGTLYYIFIYTIWLKRRTHHNVTIGGVAGAIPVLVGWAAVVGGLDLTAWLLFLIVFLWTPPHIWALTLVVKRDYARVDVPMLPVSVGESKARRQIWFYSWTFYASTLLPTLLRSMGWFYLIVALITGGLFMRGAYRVYREGQKKEAFSLYKYSLLHLALLFGGMVVDTVLIRSYPWMGW